MEQPQELTDDMLAARQHTSARPEIWNSYKIIASFPEQIRKLYQSLGIIISSQSDLEKIIDLCTNIDQRFTELSDTELLEVCHAQRILCSILACSKEAGLKEPLTRISSKPLNHTNNNSFSSGKDALFELEFLQYIKHRGLHARLDEPDIVITAPFGDYFVACKTINSFNNIEKQLQSGCRQLMKYGKGFIALNLEPHVFYEQPINALSPNKINKYLKHEILQLYRQYSLLFDRYLKKSLDGIALQVSCVASTGSDPELNIHTFTTYYYRPKIQPQESVVRFEGFVHSMCRNILQ